MTVFCAKNTVLNSQNNKLQLRFIISISSERTHPAQALLTYSLGIRHIDSSIPFHRKRRMSASRAGPDTLSGNLPAHRSMSARPASQFVRIKPQFVFKNITTADKNQKLTF